MMLKKIKAITALSSIVAGSFPVKTNLFWSFCMRPQHAKEHISPCSSSGLTKEWEMEVEKPRCPAARSLDPILMNDDVGPSSDFEDPSEEDGSSPSFSPALHFQLFIANRFVNLMMKQPCKVVDQGKLRRFELAFP